MNTYEHRQDPLNPFQGLVLAILFIAFVLFLFLMGM